MINPYLSQLQRLVPFPWDPPGVAPVNRSVVEPGRLDLYYLPPSKILQHEKVWSQANLFSSQATELARQSVYDYVGRLPIKSMSQGLTFENVTILAPSYLSLLKSKANYKARLQISDLLNSSGAGFLERYGSNVAVYRKSGINTVFIQSKSEYFNYVERARKALNAFRCSCGIIGCEDPEAPGPGADKKSRIRNYQIRNTIQKLTLAPGGTCSCGSVIGKTAEIRKTPSGSAAFHRIETCKSVWSCPVCRSRILAKRKDYLADLYKAHKSQGGEAYLITFTIPHKKEDNLARLIGSSKLKKGLSGAFRRFRQSRAWRECKEDVKYIGDIKALEITWGWGSGYHPHIHLLVLTESGSSLQDHKKRLYKIWARAAEKAGLGLPGSKAFDIKHIDNEAGATYLAKVQGSWGPAEELAGQDVKKSRRGNFSIAELEQCLIDPGYRAARRIRKNRVCKVLQIYYEVMKGQKLLTYGGFTKEYNWREELQEVLEQIQATDEELILEEEERQELIDPIVKIGVNTYNNLKLKGYLPYLLAAVEGYIDNPAAGVEQFCWEFNFNLEDFEFT